MLLHGPTIPINAVFSDRQDNIQSEDQYDDGHRAFVYAKLSAHCANEANGEDAEEELEHMTVIVRYYNEFVYSTQKDVLFDNSEAAFSSGLPDGYYLFYDEICSEGFVSEETAFKCGYVVYDFIVAWSFLKEMRRYHPTSYDDPHGRTWPVR